MLTTQGSILAYSPRTTACKISIKQQRLAANQRSTARGVASASPANMPTRCIPRPPLPLSTQEKSFCFQNLANSANAKRLIRVSMGFKRGLPSFKNQEMDRKLNRFNATDLYIYKEKNRVYHQSITHQLYKIVAQKAGLNALI